MAKITERDIINHLKQKIVYHQQESKRIELLLAAFAGSEIVDTAHDNDDLEAQFKADKKVKSAIQKPFKPLEPPAEFSANLTIVNKIAYALSVIGEGYNEQIAAVIAQNEPGSDVKKISQLISGVLSTLKASRLISARKDGRKHKFSLIK